MATFLLLASLIIALMIREWRAIVVLIIILLLAYLLFLSSTGGGGGRSPISGLGESMGVSYETLLLIPFSVGFLDFRKLLLKKIQEIILIADVETRVVLRETNRLDPAESSRRTNHWSETRQKSPYISATYHYLLLFHTSDSWASIWVHRGPMPARKQLSVFIRELSLVEIKFLCIYPCDMRLNDFSFQWRMQGTW